VIGVLTQLFPDQALPACILAVAVLLAAYLFTEKRAPFRPASPEG
jgi:hypothetical protein